MCFRHLLKNQIHFTMCFEGVESRCGVIYDADFLKCETVLRKTYVSEPTQSQAERSQVEPARARQPGRDRPPGRARHSDGSVPGSQAEPGRASQPCIFIEPALCQFVPKLRNRTIYALKGSEDPAGDESKTSQNCCKYSAEHTIRLRHVVTLLPSQTKKQYNHEVPLHNIHTHAQATTTLQS